MLHKCANPSCLRLFRKMNQGRLFQLSQRLPRSGENLRRPAGHGVEYFWLCDQCSLFFTLAFDPIGGVAAIPITRIVPADNPASSRPRLQPRSPSILGELRWTA
ncbi:MAG TPA: hypothetical protein VFB00_01480 [Terriglobales bacterium]|nr:hypothetical protein [Terriglobales bacterium]